MLFYLGTHQTGWLWLEEFKDVPLFISHRRLKSRVHLKSTATTWALDSGGFSELSMFGEWKTTPRAYAREVRRYHEEIGGLQWAAIQDWMCEDVMLKKTGLTVAEHQKRTIESYLNLQSLYPSSLWTPVLQGSSPIDYLRHADEYERQGIDLASLPVVGVGSVCRRQTLRGLLGVMLELKARGYKLHGFGVKLTGRLLWPALASSDSMAWSFAARRDKIRLDGCTHKTCANCPKWALVWREKVLAPQHQKHTGQLCLF